MKKKNYKVILFDLDGVLTDSQEGITKSIQYALSKMGIVENNREFLVRFIGPPLFHTFNSHYKLPEKEAWEAVGYFRERFVKQGMYENKVYEGVDELLKKLKKSKKKIALVSSKAAEHSIKILAHFKLNHYFDVIIGPGVNLKNEDKTSLVQRAINNFLKNKKEEFVMIGDRKYDVIGAKNNQIDSIGVTYGYGSLEELTEHKATYIVNSISELTNLII